VKDLQPPSSDTDVDPASPAVTPSEEPQATRDILASAGIKLLPESSERGKAESAPWAIASAIASVAWHEAARLFAAFATYVAKCVERAKTSMLAPKEPPPSDAGEVSPPKKLPLGALEQETTLENVLASIAIGAPAKKAALLKALLGKIPAACKAALKQARAPAAPLPKAVRFGLAALIALLIIGITLKTLRPSVHHRHLVVGKHHAVKSLKAASAHRIAAMKKHHHSATQKHRPAHGGHTLIVPEEIGSMSYDRSADAAIIVSIRRKIAHLCGLQVSKVYRWKYYQGYLFCYSRSDGQDTSTVLERSADGVFTLIGGSKGLMTYHEMTDTFLIDSEIARYLLE
jgi:hypothetical protein